MAKKKSRVPTPPAPRSKSGAATGSTNAGASKGSAPKGGTAAPPRRPVQAPKVRPKHGPRERPSWLLLALAGAGIVVLAVVVGVILATRGGSSGGTPSSSAVASAMRAAGCTYSVAKPLPFPSDHSEVPTLATPVRWTTFPPASGEHFRTPAIWGFYHNAINPRQVVHNEEHGAVVLWYGPKTPAATVAKLEAFYNQEPAAMFGTRLSDAHPGIKYLTPGPHQLGSKVAITAWGIDHQPNYFSNGDLGYGISAVCPTFDEKAFTTFRDAHRGHGPEFPYKYSLQFDQPGH